MARRKRNPKERYETLPWGRAVPYTTPTGIETFLYNIKTAANAIGRTPQTIRKWEISGTIPVTPFKVKGNRMYASEHIDVLVACAEKYRVRPGVSITNTQFSSNVYKGYKKVNEKFFGKGEGKDGKAKQ